MIITNLKGYYLEHETNTLFYDPTDFCQLPDDEGQGNNFIFSLYYDAAQDRCSPFLYKGEGGNANRFGNERDCMRNCSANAEDVYPMDGNVTLNIYISIWLLGCCSGTLERTVTNEVKIYDL